MGLEGPFASCFVSSSLAFNNYDSDLTTVLYIYLRECLVKIDNYNEEVGRKDLMDNAEELKSRLLSLGFEVN